MKKIIDKLSSFIKRVIEFKYFYLILLMIYVGLYTFPLIKFYVSGDDSTFHLGNVYYLQKYGLFSDIVPQAASNYGWGVGIFYPCLPHLVSALIGKILSISPILSLRMFKLLVMICTSLVMYLLVFKLYKNKKYAFIASLFYISSSYFFVDFYVRDTVNELMLFLFIPIVFLAFYYLFKENNKFKFYLAFVIGFSGMIYSHFLVTFFFVIVLIPFLIVFTKEIFTKKHIIHLLLATLLVVCFCSTYIYPLFLHMINNSWWIPAYKKVWVLPLRGYIVYDLYKSSSNNVLFIKLNFLSIVLFFMGIKKLISKKDKYLFGILLFTILSVFISSFGQFWKICPQFLKNIQFAWRLNIFVTFGLSILLVNGLKIFYGLFKDKYQYVGTLFIVFVVSIFTINNYYRNHFIKIDKVNYSSNISHDYFPKKAKKNIKYLEKMNNKKIIVLSKDKCNIKIINDKVPEMKFKVNDLNKNVSIQLHRLYYLGYELTDSKGKKIDYYETKYGLIGATIGKNDTYTLKYRGVKYYGIAKMLKVISIIVILVYVAYYIIKNKKKLSYNRKK